MRNLFFVRRFQRGGDLRGDLERLLQRNRALTNEVGQRRPLHQLHHQVVRSHVVEVADIEMIQRGHGADFAVEALVETLGGNFDGDIATGARVVRTVHLSHPTFAHECEDFIRGQSLSPGVQRHITDSAKFTWSRRGLRLSERHSVAGSRARTRTLIERE